MHSKKFMLLSLVSALLLFGCLNVFQPPQQDPYEIFSNIPTNNATALVYVKFSQEGIKEVREVFGTMITNMVGGSSLKKYQEGEAVVVIYNDSFAMVGYSKTNMTLQEILDEMNSTSEEKGQSLKFETKNIGGKDITIVRVENTSIDMPICVWKEGDILKTLVAVGMPRYALESASGNVTENPLIGYALKTSGYDSYGEFNNTCEVILQKKYDTAGVKEMFKETEEIKKGIPVSGTFFGEIKMFVNVSVLNGSIYGVISGDDNADYLVFAGRVNTSTEESNLCYSSSYGSGKVEVVKSGGKEACMLESGGSYLTMNLRFIVLQRKIGDYSLGLLTYIKDNKNAARDKSKDIIFSVNLPGEEGRWTDKANIKVKVYEGTYYSGTATPLAGVRVDLFGSEPYDYSKLSYVPAATPELLQTKYTDSSGAAKFENVPANESLSVVASKAGYENSTQYIYSFNTAAVIYLSKVDTSFRVTVYEQSPGDGRMPVREARVNVYSGSNLLGTNYTDESGEATFQNVSNGNVRVEVNKEGYAELNDTVYVSRYSRSTSEYLTPLK